MCMEDGGGLVHLIWTVYSYIHVQCVASDKWKKRETKT